MVETDFAASAPLPPHPGRELAGRQRASAASEAFMEALEYGTPADATPRRGGGRRLHRGSQPNVVLMNVDDTGWGDYGFNNPAVADTPILDALRSRGMRFSDMHAGASVCTPSRAALLTGRIGLRTGVTGNFMPFSLGGLPRSETTIAALLKKASSAPPAAPAAPAAPSRPAVAPSPAPAHAAQPSHRRRSRRRGT